MEPKPLPNFVEPSEAELVGSKVCVVCDKSKPFYDFSKNNNTPDRLQPHCRQCASDMISKSQLSRHGKSTGDPEEDWKIFMKTLYEDCIKPGANAATRDLYAVLVGKKVEKREVTLAMNADDLVKRQIMARDALKREAQKQLTEEAGNVIEGGKRDVT